MEETAGDVVAARFGEEGVDVERAQLSVREPVRGWGPGVSDSVGASASEIERGGTQVG